MIFRKNMIKQKIGELEYIVSNIPDLVIRINRRGEINFINTASILFFRQPPEAIVGKSLKKLIEETHIVPLDYSTIAEVFESGKAGIAEAEIRVAGEKPMNIEIRILPEPGKSTGSDHLVLMIRDITLRREAERKLLHAMQKAQESDMLKSAFLANMSHEIRTPLNAIVGFSQILLDDQIDKEEQERFFSYIRDNSNQLISLINDIIDLSKLESNQMVIRDSLVDLDQTLEDLKVMAENEKKSREKEHLRIVLEREGIASGEPIVVDPIRLKQVLINLLVNAIKFTPKGFIQFGYRIRDQKTLLFFVRDTGIGIPKEMQQEVFLYFRQLDNSLNRANSGTGLGLAICKRLVELMDGSIWFESEPRKGTTFFFTIPFRKGQPTS